MKKNTQAKIAAMLGVDRTTVSKWFGSNRSAADTSSPDARVKVPPKQRPVLAERIDAGEKVEQVAADYGISTRQARSIATKERKTKEIKKKVIDGISRNSKAAERILQGDFRNIGDVVPDNSIDLILTDPPYDKESSFLYGDIAKLAARVLKPGCWCLVYAGHSFLPDIYKLMNLYLDYGWTFAVLHKGGDVRFRKYKFQVKWKPIIGFYKPPLNVWWDWFADVVSGGKEKTDHEWQQALSEAEYFIEKLTLADAIVLDPLCGSGTVCLAAKKLQRQWLGIEINEETRNIAIRKLK